MEVFVGLLIVWVIITLVGHISWLMTAAFFRIIASFHAAPNPSMLHDSLSIRQRFKDRQATSRVLQQLYQAGVIDEQESQSLQHKLGQLDALAAPPSESTAHVELSPSLATTVDAAPAQASLAKPRPPVPMALTVDPAAATADVDDLEEPIIARLHSEPERPAVRLAEMIQSFLATHNIRWGELIAGLLIVACSIGLVISLWNTIVSTHRVVPSLILLAGNAAIFAAGLYTLSRWKLRHTSRSVLVIATLLVPLSVLASLAAGLSHDGLASESVQLDDPVTLVALFGGVVVYGLLLWLGSTALVGRSMAKAMALSVAGPAAVMPLLPAACRAMGANAGWVVGIGAISIIVAIVVTLWQRRDRRAAQRTMGTVAARNFLLLMFVGFFAMTVSVGYSLFFIRGDLTFLLPIVIAVIPALVAFAGAGGLLSSKAARVPHQMVGAVVTILALALAWTVLAVAIDHWHWTWLWAAILSASCFIVARALQQPLWLAASTLPIGIVSVLSAAVWWRAVPWSSLPLWMRLVSGEAMLTAMLLALIMLAIRYFHSAQPFRRCWGYTAISFGVLGSGIAACLAVLPLSWMDSLPVWTVTAVLSFATIVTVPLALKRDWFSYATIALVGLAWASQLKPFVFLSNEMLSGSTTWQIMGIAVAATLIVLCEYVRATGKETSHELRPDRIPIWTNALTTLLAVTSVYASVVAGSDWQSSAIILGSASGLLLWAATTARSLRIIAISQVVWLACTITIGFGLFWTELFSRSLWSQGDSLWYWSLLLSTTALPWLLIRQLSMVRWSIAADRLGFMDPSSGELASRPWHIVSGRVDDLILMIAWLCSFTAAVLPYVGCLFASTGRHFPSSTVSVLVPIACFAISIVFAILAWRFGQHQTRERASFLTCTALLLPVGLIIWSCTRACESLLGDPVWQLVMATTTGASCLIAWSLLSVRMPFLISSSSGCNDNRDVEQRYLAATLVPVLASGLLFFAASFLLLVWHWAIPIVEGQKASMLATVSVALWCGVVSLLLWLVAARSERMLQPSLSNLLNAKYAAIGSAFFYLAAATIATPAVATVHPFVWLQVAAIATLGWIGLNRWFTTVSQGESIDDAARMLWQFLFFVGIVSAVIKLIQVIFSVDALDAVSGPASAVVSFVALGCWCIGVSPKSNLPGSPKDPCDVQTHWISIPIGLSLAAGQLTWALSAMFPLLQSYPLHVLCVIWLICAFASLIEHFRRKQATAFWHSAMLSVVLASLALLRRGVAPEWMDLIGLTACFVSGGLVAVVGMRNVATKMRGGASVALSWFVVLAGGSLAVRFVDLQLFSGMGQSEVVASTLIAWLSFWIVAWRVIGLIRDDKPKTAPKTELETDPSHQDDAAVGLRLANHSAIADSGLFGLLVLAAVSEATLSTIASASWLTNSLDQQPLLLCRLVCYTLVAASTILRGDRLVIWQGVIATGLSVVVMLVSNVSRQLDLTVSAKGTFVCISLSTALTILVYSLRPLSRNIARISSYFKIAHPVPLARLVDASVPIALLVMLLGAFVSVSMIHAGVPAATIRLTIVAVAMMAVVFFELSETSKRSRLRHVAVMTGLVSVGLWASVIEPQQPYPWLHASMQWLVASVFATASLLFVLPRLLGRRMTVNWHGALRSGSFASAAAAAGSLLVMLGLEAVVRQDSGIDGLSRTLVVGVGVILAIMSLLAAIVAVLSGPRFSLSDTLRLTNWQRQGLIIASQLIAVFAWLHLFLCKASFVFLGVASMVWHAQVSIDAVWPWWVFGIGTGVLLLTGLMWVEKNRPKLRQYANALAAWEG